MRILQRPLESPKTISPEGLARNFGPAARIAQEGVAQLYAALGRAAEPPVRGAISQWQSAVAPKYAPVLEPSSAAARELAGLYRESSTSPDLPRLMLAVQTYYAVVVAKVTEAAAAGLSAGPPALQGGLSPGEELLRPLFSWPLTLDDDAVQARLRQIAAQLGDYEFRPMGDGARDLFKDLYLALFPGRLRRALGQYYTPDWLVDLVLDEVGYTGTPGDRLLDPACGSGSFLIAAFNRLCRRSDSAGVAQGERSPAGAVETDTADRFEAAAQAGTVSGAEPGRSRSEPLDWIVGFEIDPVAAVSARANARVALCARSPRAVAAQIAVRVCDAILDPAGAESGHGFQYIVGNPPWIVWDHLPPEYRRATKRLWQRYGLFSLPARAARHGGAKKDLAMLMLYAAADRYLAAGGRLGLVVPQSLLHSKGAGDGFRRLRLGDRGPWLRMLRVNDLAALRPFAGASHGACTVVLEKGSRTVYPVPYVRWSADRGRESLEAEPIDVDRPSSPWLVRPPGSAVDFRRLARRSEYDAHLGANTGGANGVYWVNIVDRCPAGVRIRNLAGCGHRRVRAVEQVIEGDQLYPLLRWSGIGRYRAVPSGYVLLVQDARTRRGLDPASMAAHYPQTLDYLGRFRRLLERRAAYRRYQRAGPWWSMYDVGTYTLSPVKVVWRRMDRRVRAAVATMVEDPWLGARPVVPQETCVLLAAADLEEAHYLCALLNSSVVDFLVRGHSVCGGKGFGTPSILDFAGLQRFQGDNPEHLALAACSRRAHEWTAAGKDCRVLEEQINVLAGRLWGLSAEDLSAIGGAAE
jgi:hypothetical protein